jgi:hypothetical protein
MHPYTLSFVAGGAQVGRVGIPARKWIFQKLPGASNLPGGCAGKCVIYNQATTAEPFGVTFFSELYDVRPFKYTSAPWFPCTSEWLCFVN